MNQSQLLARVEKMERTIFNQQKMLEKNARATESFNSLFYIYEFNLASIAPGISAVDTINIDSDSDFVWLKTTILTTNANASQTEGTRLLPLINVQLTDTGSGRQFFNEVVPLASIGGDGRFPFILPRPQRFGANSTVKMDFTNFDAAVTYVNTSVALIGYKRYL